MNEYLIIVEPRDTEDELHPLYWGTIGHQTGPFDDPPDTFFEDRLDDPGNFEQHLWSLGTTRGESSVGVGDLVIVRLFSGGLDDDANAWISWKWKGARITIKRWTGIGQVVDAETVLIGTCTRLLADADTYVLQIHDRLTDLDKPLLTHRYAGTTTAPGLGIEGNEDLEGQLKPKVYGGPNYSVDIKWVNVHDNIGQVSDGPVSSIELLSGGNEMTNDGDHPTVEAMVAAPLPAIGHYLTCLNQGLVLPGSNPQQGLQITANVTEGATAADRTMAQIVRRMMLDFGLDATEINDASFDALDALNSSVCGIVIDGEEQARSAMMRVLASDFGYLISNNADEFEIGRLEPPSGTPVVSLDEDSIGEVDYESSGDTELGEPAGRVIVLYAEVLTVMTGSQLAGILTQEERTFFENQWRRSTPAESENVLELEPNAPEIIIESRFVDKADADTAAVRGLSIYSVQRVFAAVPVSDINEIWNVQCNSIIALTLNDLNFEDNKLFRVLGRVLNLEDDTATLIVWA